MRIYQPSQPARLFYERHLRQRAGGDAQNGRFHCSYCKDAGTRSAPIGLIQPEWNETAKTAPSDQVANLLPIYLGQYGYQLFRPDRNGCHVQ